MPIEIPQFKFHIRVLSRRRRLFCLCILTSNRLLGDALGLQLHGNVFENSSLFLFLYSGCVLSRPTENARTEKSRNFRSAQQHTPPSEDDFPCSAKSISTFRRNKSVLSFTWKNSISGSASSWVRKSFKICRRNLYFVIHCVICYSTTTMYYRNRNIFFFFLYNILLHCIFCLTVQNKIHRIEKIIYVLSFSYTYVSECRKQTLDRWNHRRLLPRCVNFIKHNIAQHLL